MTPEELLAVYDAEVRGAGTASLPVGWTGEQDGPLMRCLTPRDGFAMFTPVRRTLGRMHAIGLPRAWHLPGPGRSPAQATLAAGYTILLVDASDDSRPILERLGLHVVGGTTPYVTSHEPR